MASRRTARGITRRFSNPTRPIVVLADNAKWLRERWAANGVPADAMERHLAVLGNKAAMEAALAWYRARGAIRRAARPIRVPTLYIWGDADDTVGRMAAEGTQDFVAAPYRFEVLPGVGHFAADQEPDRVSEYCCSNSPPIRSDRPPPAKSRGTSPPRKCCPAANGA